MTTVLNALQPGDCQAFEAGGQRFVYLAPSAAVMAVDDVSAAVLDSIRTRARTSQEIVADLDGRFTADEVAESLDELLKVRALRRVDTPARRPPVVVPLTPGPLSTTALSVTSQ